MRYQDVKHETLYSRLQRTTTFAFFKKDGNNLVFEIEIPQVEALIGCRLSVSF